MADDSVQLPPGFRLEQPGTPAPKTAPSHIVLPEGFTLEEEQKPYNPDEHPIANMAEGAAGALAGLLNPMTYARMLSVLDPGSATDNLAQNDQLIDTLMHGSRQDIDHLIGGLAGPTLLGLGLKLGAQSSPVQNYLGKLGRGADIKTNTEVWQKGLQKIAEGLGFGANDTKAAQTLTKAAPLIKQEETLGTTRPIVDQSMLGGAPGAPIGHNGALGDIPWQAQVPFQGPRLPWLGSAPDFLKLNDIFQAALSAKQRLWNQSIQPWIDAHAANGTMIDTAPIMQRMASAGTDYARLADPQGAAAAAGRASQIYGQRVPVLMGNQIQVVTIPKQISVPTAFDYLKGINAALDVFDGKAPGDVQALTNKGMSYNGLLEERNALHDQIYGLDQTGNIRDQMSHYGALIETGDQLMGQMAASLGHDPNKLVSAAANITRAGTQAKLGEYRGAASNFATGAMKILTPVEGSGDKLQEGFRKLKLEPPQWGPPTPPTPMPQQGPQLGGGPLVPTGGAGVAPQQGPPNFTRPGQGPQVSVQFGPKQLPAAPQGQLQQPLIPKSRQLAAPPESPGATQPMPGGFQPPPGLPPVSKPPIITEPPPQLNQSNPPPLQFNPKGNNWIDPETGEVFDSSLGLPSQPFTFGGSAGMPMLHHGNPGFSMGSRLNRRVTGSLPHMPSLPKPKPMGGAKMAPTPFKAPAAPAVPAQPGFPQSPVPVIPAAKGVQTSAPTKAVVGELGPERIDHSDGRPSEIVSGAQSRVLGANGQDKVTPLAGKKPPMGIVRGSSNIPMNDRGRQEASALGQHLAKAGGLDELHMSDLDRTVETAKLIAAAGGAKQMVKPDAGLRSWGLGGAEGTPITPELDNAIHRMAQEAPDTPLPGKGPASTQPGESYNQFKDRHLKAMAQLLARLKANPKAKIGVVTHNKDMRLDHAWITAGAPGPAESANILPTRDGFHNAGAQHISLGANGKPQVKPWKPGDKLKPGILQIRHGETDWSPASDENAS